MVLAQGVAQPQIIPTHQSITKLAQSANLALRECAKRMRERHDRFFLFDVGIADRGRIIWDGPIQVEGNSLPEVRSGCVRFSITNIETADDVTRIENAIQAGITPENVLANISDAPPSIKNMAEKKMINLGVPVENITTEAPSASSDELRNGSADDRKLIQFDAAIATRLNRILNQAA